LPQKHKQGKKKNERKKKKKQRRIALTLKNARQVRQAKSMTTNCTWPIESTKKRKGDKKMSEQPQARRTGKTCKRVNQKENERDNVGPGNGKKGGKRNRAFVEGVGGIRTKIGYAR